MKLGSNDISAVKIGSTDVSKVYIGSTEVWSSFTGLLDDYPNAAAAYSLRKLRADYTGDAIEVRIDTTGQPTYDIGFVNGELDTATLEGYCTGGLDAYVTTWYDQSGNGRDVTQTTAANQPQIVSGGSVILINSKPSIKFQDSTDFLRRTTSSGTSTSNTMAVVFKFNLSSGYGVIMSIGDTGSPCYGLLAWGVSPYNRAIYNNTFRSEDGVYTQNQEIWGSTTDTNSAKLWVNGTSETITNSTSTYTANLNDIQIGNDTFGSTLYPNIQEAIYWNTTKSDSDLVGINTNQNNFYSVY